MIQLIKSAETHTAFIGNNHGSLAEIAGQWFIFYHRHTHCSSYSRQACLEPVRILPDGRIPQVEITSCGPHGGPLPGRGECPAYTACNLMLTQEPPVNRLYGHNPFPHIRQDGPDGSTEPAYIANMTQGVIAGFKYYDCQDVRQIRVKVRGMVYGARFEVRTALEGPVLGVVPLKGSNEWHAESADIAIPDGIQALYFKMMGYGVVSLLSFELI